MELPKNGLLLVYGAASCSAVAGGIAVVGAVMTGDTAAGVFCGAARRRSRSRVAGRFDVW